MSNSGTSSLAAAGTCTKGTVHKITHSESVGYAATVFDGKHEQMLRVCSQIEEKGFVPRELINNEVAWFYGYLIIWFFCICDSVTR